MNFLPFELDKYQYNTENMSGGLPLSESIHTSEKKESNEFTIIGGNSPYKSRLTNMVVPAGLVITKNNMKIRDFKIIDGGFLNENDFDELFGMALHYKKNNKTKRNTIVFNAKYSTKNRTKK
jgi:hypothetical protein